MNGRKIVFHADDLGMSAAVDDGILQCFEHGLLTSTSVLANGPTAATGLARVRQASDAWQLGETTDGARRLAVGDTRLPFDLGVHLNLTQGRPLTGARYPARLLDADGRFPGAGALFAAVVRHGGRAREAIEAELAAQVAMVFDHGVRPTHVNGHQYVELFPHVRGAVLSVCQRFGIRSVRVAVERRLAATTLGTRGIAAWGLAHVKRAFAQRFARLTDRAGLAHADGYFGTAHAGHVTLDALARRLRAHGDERLLEVGIHPAARCSGDETRRSASDGWDDPLAPLRPAESALLCSDELARLIVDRGLTFGRLAVGHVSD